MPKKLKKRKNFYDKLKEEYKYLKTSWSVQTEEFFENSTLHGVKYIAATDRPFIERFMWFVCVTIGTVATCAVILSLWEKFQTNPTITGLDTDFHNWQVPFPAITLCPEKPASMEKIRSVLGITENSSYVEEEKAEYFYDLSRLTINSIPDFVKKYHEKVPYLNGTQDIRKVVSKVIDDCNDIFGQCLFRGVNEMPCCDIFYPVFTESGFCYTFNSRHFENNGSNVKPNMQYIEETDSKWSLIFTVKHTEVSTPVSHSCILLLAVAVQLYIVNSDEMIGIDVQPQHIWKYKVYKMSFSIKQTYTTEDTRQLSIKQRRCVFEDEIKLEVDHIYTYTACAIQCRMENTKSLCGCVPYFYPRTAHFPFCTLDKLDCIAKNLDDIKNIDRCDCQLGCQNTVYEVEAQNVVPESVTDTMEVEFVSWPMVRYKREVLFGWVDLLVSFGGIAGLFLGFSLLSAVEIVYYFTIRACVASFRERKDLDRIRKEKSEKSKKAYDLSLVPYYISQPLPGQGIDEIAKRYANKRFGNQVGDFGVINKKTMPGNSSINMEKWAVANTIIPPFGIEFVN